MPYYDSTLTQVYNYTRGWYTVSDGKTIGFALALPKNYNTEISYPLILSYGGSQNGSNDVYGGSSMGMFDSNSVTSFINEGSYPYENGEEYISLAFQSCGGENALSVFPEGLLTAVEEIIAANNNVVYYTKWGTTDDGQGYTHQGQWGMPLDANPDTIGSSSSIFVNIDADRIYYTGFSLGSAYSACVSYYGRDLLAGIMSYEGGVFPYSGFDEFYDYVKGLLSSNDNNLVPSDNMLNDNYYSNAVGEGITQPSLWDMENHDFADGTPGTSLSYSEGNRLRQIFIMEELFKSFKHLPVLVIQSWNTAGQGPARNAQSLQEGLYTWNNAKDITWNTFIAVNSIKNGNNWVGYEHGSQTMWEAVFGGVSSGFLHVFNPNIDDINHAIGLSPVLPENQGDGTTCLEWLLSKRKSTNPSVENFTGWPENNWLTVTLSESETNFIFDTTHSIEHHADGNESLNYAYFIRFEKNGDNIDVRDFNHNILVVVPPDSSRFFTFLHKNYTVVRNGENTKLFTPQKYLI